jgi:hypothetical protein
MRGWRWEKGREGPLLFPTDRTPNIFIRSLFGSGIVEFGIAVCPLFPLCYFSLHGINMLSFIQFRLNLREILENPVNFRDFSLHFVDFSKKGGAV